MVWAANGIKTTTAPYAGSPTTIIIGSLKDFLRNRVPNRIDHIQKHMYVRMAQFVICFHIA